MGKEINTNVQTAENRGSDYDRYILIYRNTSSNITENKKVMDNLSFLVSIGILIEIFSLTRLEISLKIDLWLAIAIFIAFTTLFLSFVTPWYYIHRDEKLLEELTKKYKKMHPPQTNDPLGDIDERFRKSDLNIQLIRNICVVFVIFSTAIALFSVLDYNMESSQPHQTFEEKAPFSVETKAPNKSAPARKESSLPSRKGNTTPAPAKKGNATPPPAQK